jgi:hypothetical protein
MEKYFLYARKSSEWEDRQVQSIPDQIDTMTKKAKNIWIIVIAFFEEEMSAKAPWRPVFNEMIKRIKKGEAKGIIAWKLDRLSRNPIDSWTIQYMLQTGELANIITSDRTYTEVDAWLLFSVESWIWNQFILDLKKNTKRWLDFKVSQGIFCSMVPEWYLNKRDDKVIIVDLDKFNLVRKMWDLMLSWNYTVPQVLNIASNEWWFRTRITKKRWGTKLSLSGLYRIFNNIFYTWDFLWKWQIRKGTHRPMITYNEFYRVQEMIWKRGIHIRWKTREFSYTWFMKCWECGSAITAEEKHKLLMTWEKNVHVYYRCTKRKTGCKNCGQRPIKLEDLERQINTLLTKIEIIPEFKKRALEALNNDFECFIETKRKIQNNLQVSINSTERKLEKLTEALLWELIEDEEYKISKKQLKIEIGILREKLNKLNLEKDESFDDTERLFNFIVEARMQFNHWDLQTKKEIFRALGLNWILKDWILHYTAFPWFKHIKKYNKENTSLEPTKNRTSKGKANAKNMQKYKWLQVVRLVRMSILEYWEKLYFPEFH